MSLENSQKSVVPDDFPSGKLSLEDRNNILLLYLPHVKFIANRIASRLPHHIELEDLVSAGKLGLIDAISKFDPSRKIKFKTYAEFRIKGAILDDLRNQDWVPRSVRRQNSVLENAVHKVERTKLRRATPEDIAEVTLLPIEEVHDMLIDTTRVIISLDEPQTDSKGSPIDLLPDTSERADQKMIRVQQRAITLEAIKFLPRTEQVVISLHYFAEMTLLEIGDSLGVTESRASQIHSQALDRLMKRLRERLREGDLTPDILFKEKGYQTGIHTDEGELEL